MAPPALSSKSLNKGIGCLSSVNFKFKCLGSKHTRNFCSVPIFVCFLTTSKGEFHSLGRWDNLMVPDSSQSSICLSTTFSRVAGIWYWDIQDGVWPLVSRCATDSGIEQNLPFDKELVSMRCLISELIWSLTEGIGGISSTF